MTQGVWAQLLVVEGSAPPRAGAVKLNDFEWHEILSVTFLIMLEQTLSLTSTPQNISSTCNSKESPFLLDFSKVGARVTWRPGF